MINIAPIIGVRKTKGATKDALAYLSACNHKIYEKPFIKMPFPKIGTRECTEGMAN